MRQTLCVHLRRWPIDRLLRRRPGLRRKAFVLLEVARGRQLVAHVSPDAPSGVRPGVTVAEARACCPALACLPTAPADDRRALEALGRWMMRFSPGVCVEPPAVVLLDATGLERLYGGLANFRRLVARAVAALGVVAGVALAPTPAAARALAASGGGERAVVDEAGLLDALAPLPVAALRLDAATVGALGALGIYTIRQLQRLPRPQLATRFGPAVLRRIDEATGAVDEPLAFLTPRTLVCAAVEFEGAVDGLESTHAALRQLLAEVAAELARRGLGAREIKAVFSRAYAPPIEKAVRLSRPSRDAQALFRLLCCALETVQSDEGFVGLRLRVSASERMGDGQAALIGGEVEDRGAEQDHLIERLRARLERGVEWARPTESHLPERAFQCQDEVPAGPAVVRRVPRPLRLFPMPREVRMIVAPSHSRDGRPVSFTHAGQVHRLAQVRGPERIGGEWWNGRWKTRDYFDAQDAGGGRYWIFRVMETGRWFLHGMFE